LHTLVLLLLDSCTKKRASPDSCYGFMHKERRDLVMKNVTSHHLALRKYKRSQIQLEFVNILPSSINDVAEERTGLILYLSTTTLEITVYTDKNKL